MMEKNLPDTAKINVIILTFVLIKEYSIRLSQLTIKSHKTYTHKYIANSICNTDICVIWKLLE